MGNLDKAYVINKFYEARSSFLISLNVVIITSVTVFTTVIFPYLTYVSNIMDVRKNQKICLNRQEKAGNFDLLELEAQWLKEHEPSIDRESFLTDESSIKSPLGEWSINKAQLVLIYPISVSIIVVYIFLTLNSLYKLRKEIDNNLNNLEKTIIRLPTWRITLSFIILYFCILTTGLGLTLRRYNINESSFRLGRIVTQETYFQVGRQFDLLLNISSILLCISAPVFYFKKLP